MDGSAEDGTVGWDRRSFAENQEKSACLKEFVL
jgi:hypothetical protein